MDRMKEAELLVEHMAVNKMAKLSPFVFSKAVRAGKVAFLAGILGSSSSRYLIKRARSLRKDLQNMGRIDE